MKKAIAFLKRYKATLLISIIAIAVAQCGGSKSTTSSVKIDPFKPQDGDVTIAQKHWQGTTLSQLQEGYGVYASACTNCHGMKNIKDYSMNDWPGIIDEMGKKARLDSVNYKLVYRYIMTHREALGN